MYAAPIFRVYWKRKGLFFMQINRYINGKKTQNMPQKVENEAVKEVIAEVERRIRTTEQSG